MWFYQNTAPMGWVIDSTPADAILAVKGGSAAYNVNGGMAAGTWTHPTHTHTGPSHTHTGPSHTHTGPSHAHSILTHTHTFSAGAHTHTTTNHTLSVAEMPSHRHVPMDGLTNQATHQVAGSPEPTGAWIVQSGTVQNVYTSYTGGNETRPINTYRMMIIKAY